MLVSLSVKNYALIENLEISFHSNFSTITGETGAGKSIVLGALGLIMGERADLSTLKNADKKCVIEAGFSIKTYNLSPVFDEFDIDYEDLTIIRREIHPNGKSRAFVNDTPVNLSDLQALSSKLIDIHSQTQTRDLENTNYQIEILDNIAANNSLLDEYVINLKEYKKLKAKLIDLKFSKEQFSKDQDYNAFLFNELDSIDLEKIDIQLLENEINQLSNVELIDENLSRFLAISDEESLGIYNLLHEAKNAIFKISNLNKEYELLSNRMNSLEIEFKDILTTIVQFKEHLVFDPEVLEKNTQLLASIQDLQRKHQVNSIQELIEIKNDLDKKLVEFSNLDEDIEVIQKEIDILTNKLNTIASEISKNRHLAANIFKEKTENYLAYLGMQDAQFDFNFSEVTDFLENGKEKLDLLFTANKGGNFGSLKKVASGGEKSRIMLAIKTVLAEYTLLPTIIFDEIDTGVSGEIAIKMGDLMKQMCDKRQVFAITHLPQVAAKGNYQYKVYKEVINNLTSTHITLLDNQQRIKELAEMLSGKAITETALSHAKYLLE